MRRLITGLLIGALAVLTGCNGIPGLPDLSPADFDRHATGNIIVAFPSKNSRSIQATTSDIHKVDIKVEHANKKNPKTRSFLMSEILGGYSEVEFNGLQPGSTVVSATAFMKNGKEIGAGESTVQIKKNATVSAYIDLLLVGEDNNTDGGNLKAIINIIEPSKTPSESDNISKPESEEVNTFSHNWTSVSDPKSENFLVARSNVRKYVETWGGPNGEYSYWGVNLGNQEGYLIYKYDFDNPIKSAELFVETASFNQLNYGGSNAGFGSVYVEASPDGRSWISLIESPAPQIATVDYQTYNKKLPKKLMGQTTIWIRARLFSSHIGYGTMYAHGQFGRSLSPRKMPVYSMTASF